MIIAFRLGLPQSMGADGSSIPFVSPTATRGPLVYFRNEVARHFFAQHAAYVARAFRIDGLRFDVNRVIHIDDAPHIYLRGAGDGWRFIREIREKVKAVHPGIVMRDAEQIGYYDGGVGTLMDPTTISYLRKFVRRKIDRAIGYKAA